MTDHSIPAGKVLATISPSAPRRIMGIVVLASLGTVLVYLALAKPPAELHWQIFLLVLGGATLFVADGLRRATAMTLELTSEMLRQSDGRVLARIADVTSVERGTFAVKPSNGFLLNLNAPQDGGNHWAPGLWWRLGRRVGIGGITAASETKAVAELIAALVVEHREKAEAPTDDPSG